MEKTKKITRVVAGFAALLMCGVAMTGCSNGKTSDEKKYYLNGDTNSNSFIILYDSDELKGEAFVQNVEWLSIDSYGNKLPDKLYDYEIKNGKLILRNKNKLVGIFHGFSADIYDDNNRMDIIPDASDPYTVYTYIHVKSTTK